MCHMSCVMFHASRVTCHLSHVTCHLSHVFFFIFFFTLSLKKKLIKHYTTKNIEQSGGAIWWRVCYQQGLTRLVIMDEYDFFLNMKYGLI